MGAATKITEDYPQCMENKLEFGELNIFFTFIAPFPRRSINHNMKTRRST